MSHSRRRDNSDITYISNASSVPQTKKTIQPSKKCKAPSAIAIAPAINRDADQADSESIHGDRDGNGGQKHQCPLPARRVEDIGRQKAQAEERIEVAQSAAGFDNLQLIISQVDNVAVEINRNSEQSDKEDTQLLRRAAAIAT